MTDLFTELGKKGTVSLYENEAALPFAFFVEEEMKQVDNEDFNCFEYQNQIYENISTGVDKKVLEKAEWEPVEYVNCEQAEDGFLWITDPDEESYVDYRLHLTEAGSYYMQYLGSHAAKVVARINGGS